MGGLATISNPVIPPAPSFVEGSAAEGRSPSLVILSEAKDLLFFAASAAAIAFLLLPFPLRAQTPGQIRFDEIGEKAGVRHVHRTRRFGGKNGDVLRMFTSGGSSAAVGDFDNDGFDDLFVTNSDTGRPNRLYRNNGDLTFTDVTEAAGVAGGNDPLSIVADALWFDYDNDGWRDLLVARFGTPILYRNEGAAGNARFRDVTEGSGLDQFANTIAAIAFDSDSDGDLDLLFGNYFQPVNLFDLDTTKVLPNDLDNAINGGGVTFWRNNGDGTFSDTTEKSGSRVRPRPGRCSTRSSPTRNATSASGWRSNGPARRSPPCVTASRPRCASKSRWLRRKFHGPDV